MLIDLQGEGPVMWLGWGADYESPVYQLTEVDVVSLLEGAIEHITDDAPEYPFGWLDAIDSLGESWKSAKDVHDTFLREVQS